ncbi:MAG: hypothetical protein IAE97_07330 [Chthoniobacterales bacterium]|nr:hypothetical protein [Chthoniobacterales bacterium]
MKPTDRGPSAAGFPWRRALVVALAISAAASLVIGAGFDVAPAWRGWLTRLDVFLALCFAMLWISDLLGASQPAAAIRRRRAELALIALGLGALLLFNLVPESVRGALATELHETTGSLVLWIVRAFLLACVFLQLLRALEWTLSRGLRAEIILAASFVGIITAGALLLLMPNAMQDGVRPLSPIDALFTSASAACVTGLTVRDLGTEFSTLGQMITLVTIQVGGLGIVTFVALLSSISNKTLPVPQMVVFRQMINAPAMGDLRRRIAGIVAITIILEGAGAAALYAFVDAAPTRLARLEWAVFHSVSAFCNAGFALQKDSLESLASNFGATSTIMLLIVFGGLGFLVIPEFLSVIWRGRGNLLRPAGQAHGTACAPRLRFSVQTRLSLLVTAALILLGTAGFWCLESGHVLRGMGTGEAFANSLFQSVTPRTAGFNTVPIGDLQNATLFLIVSLMVVGGCPVSTAGGIKTVTFAILLLGLRALITQQSRIEAFGRSIPARVVFSALNVFLLYMGAAMAGLVLLSWCEPHLAVRDVLFECFSALSTVGLSTGITGQLGDGGKLVLCALMFIGRIGPIAMVLSVFQTSHPVDYEFPQEDVVVG